MTGFVFDASAALKRLRESPAGPNLPNLPNRDNLLNSRLGELGGLGQVRTSDPDKASASHLPKEPRNCAFCGKSDWGVAMTLKDGKSCHVKCAPSTSYWKNPNH